MARGVLHRHVEKQLERQRAVGLRSTAALAPPMRGRRRQRARGGCCAPLAGRVALTALRALVPSLAPQCRAAPTAGLWRAHGRRGTGSVHIAVPRVFLVGFLMVPQLLHGYFFTDTFCIICQRALRCFSFSRGCSVAFLASSKPRDSDVSQDGRRSHASMCMWLRWMAAIRRVGLEPLSICLDDTSKH